MLKLSARIIGILVILLGMSLTATAEAHRLKVFATVEDGVVHGYAFFVGGGRPSEANLVIRNAAGVELYRGQTDAEGGFRFKPATATDLSLAVDAGDGHVADTKIAASRFPPGASLAMLGSAQAANAASPGGSAQNTALPGQSPSQAELSALIDRSVDAAVARQIGPLLEAYAQADGRARFNDVVSGILAIIGLAGLLVWGSTRRRRQNDAATPQGRS